MEAKHTPGPWYHVGGSDSRKAPYIRAVGDALPGTMAIAQVGNRGSYAEHLANAKLIAAAPELLDALQLMRNTWDMPDDTKKQREKRAKAWNACGAAIAKATGQPCT